MLMYWQGVFYWGFARVVPIGGVRGKASTWRDMHMTSFLRLCCLLLFFYSQSGFALNCTQLKHMVAMYLKMHFKFEKFDDKLSERTLRNFLRSWDPGKAYLFQKDVDTLTKRYRTTLDDQISKGSCRALDDIINTFSMRFHKVHSNINNIINAKHNFEIDEYMFIDRRKISYAKNQRELDERWRKRIKFQLLQLKSSLDDMDKVHRKLTKRYQLIALRHKELDSDDVYDAFLSAFATALDPHSDYLAAEDLEDFQIRTRLSLEGIGAVLRSEDGFTVIQSLVPGGAAERSGLLKENDKIIGVAQAKGESVDIIDMDLREVVKLIRGERGTKVRLTILREREKDTQRSSVSIVREKIKLKDQEVSSKVYQLKAAISKQKSKLYNIAVIDLPSFYIDFEGRQNKHSDFKSSSRDLQHELTKLKKQKIDALVLDLRSNGGGSLDEAINVAGLFIPAGPIVQVKATGRSVKVHRDEDNVTHYNGPLVVLVNRHSASASEIVAGAVQDYQRGIIVGDAHTFGKGTVQSLSEVSRTIGALKVTISKFYRPSGSSTQLQGVESDIVFPSIADKLEMGEKYYDYALEWERIKQTKYKLQRHTLPYTAKLAQASSERIKNDPQFREIIANIKEFTSQKEERTRVSLQEKPVEQKKTDKDKQKTTDATPTSDEPHVELHEDPYLQETLKVTSDYLRLRAGAKLVPTTIPILQTKTKK